MAGALLHLHATRPPARPPAGRSPRWKYEAFGAAALAGHCSGGGQEFAFE